MKRLLTMLLAGLTAIPTVGWAQQVASSFSYPVDNYTPTMCFGWGGTRSGSLHVGQDVQCNNVGAEVRSVANGRVMFAGPHGTGVCSADAGNWGTLIVIEHTMPGGNKVCSIYGHVNVNVSVGDIVTKGQTIGSVKDFSCPEGWTDHVHVGIYNGPFGDGGLGVYPSWLHGYLPPGSWPGDYLKPDDFINEHATPLYRCTWHSNSPTRSGYPGDVLNGLFVKYTNTGSEYWENTIGVTNPRYVELRSVDALGNVTNCPFTPVGWTNAQRVKSIDTSPINPGQVATFTFSMGIPVGTPPGDYQIWFRPAHGGQLMDDWGAVNIPIHVNTPIPPGPCGTRDITGTCTTRPHPIIPPASAQTTAKQ